jgi:hypothetical protein
VKDTVKERIRGATENKKEGEDEVQFLRSVARRQSITLVGQTNTISAHESTIREREDTIRQQAQRIRRLEAIVEKSKSKEGSSDTK